MYSLAAFSLSDMTECAAELRKLGSGASSIQDVAQRVAQYLYGQLGNDHTGQRDCALVRCFLTRPYQELDPQSQDCARRVLGRAPNSPDMKCLTLFGTAGERPEWNERDRSRRYRAIPLAGNQFVSQFPMVSQLLQQLGADLTSASAVDSDLLVDWVGQTFNVFHVPEAKGSPFVPVQQEFVVPFGIESVLGFGGVLPSNALFTVILFSKQTISRATAELFKPLALSVKLALLSFDQSGPPRSISRVESQPGQWESRAEALEQLLVVHEQTVIHDAVQRKRAEDALLESEERYRSLVTQANDIIYRTDVMGRFTIVNPTATRIMQYSEQELLGRRFIELIRPDCRMDAERFYGRQFIRKRASTYYEFPAIAKDGSEVWIGQNVQVLLEHGEVVGFQAVARDITERKRAEEELRRSQSFITSVVENLPNMIFVKDAKDLTFVRFNKAGEELLGHAREDLIGKSDYDFFPKAEADFFTEKDRQVLESGRLLDIPEEPIETKRQGRRLLHTKKIPLYDEKGTPQYLLGISEDITQRKRAEQELCESEARLRAILDNSPGMVFLKDAEGRYLHVNRQFERAFRMTREHVVGKTDEAIFSPEQAAAFRANDLKVLQAGVPLEFEEVAMLDDGPHTSIVSKFPLYGEDGKPYALCGITTDITERKRAEEARNESEERYRSIFENAVEGMFQTTLDGRFVAVNPALARMYGYDSPDDMVAAITNIASQLYVDPGRRDEFVRLMRQQGEVTGFEVQVRRKDGSLIWVSESVRVLRDQAGEPAGYEGTVENITDRKLAEQRVHDTLDQVRRLSGRLATVQEEERTRIARELHDELGVWLTCLKIDLSSLQSMAAGISEAVVRANVTGKIRSMVEQVEATIASVQRLVSELRPGVLDDLGLVAAIEWQCQDFQKRTGIPCTCVTNEDEMAVEAEPATAFFRVCQEALTNTARHARATAVTVKLERLNGLLRLVVADNGVGIPDAQLSDRRSFGLLGMKERIALIGGTLVIQGRPGEGTTVTACAPASSS